MLARGGRFAVRCAENHADAATSAHDEQDRENDVISPRAVSRIASEDGKQAKHLNREQCQAEDLTRGG